jgi:hypothetical protein
MCLKLELFTAIALLSFGLPTEAHDIYSPLRDRLGNSCCHEGDCRPAPYRMTPTGVQMFVDGEWIAVPDYMIQYRALLGDTGETDGGHWCGRMQNGRARGWTMLPTARSYRQTRQRFLNQRLPFVKAASSLFLNRRYANYRPEMPSRLRSASAAWGGRIAQRVV